MAPVLTPSWCSLAEIDPYAVGPASVPLHPPPPWLPENVVACGGRQTAELLQPFTLPALAEDLVIIHLRFPKRLVLKVERWVQVDSTPGDLVLIPRGQATSWGGEGAAEALLLGLPPTLTQKAALHAADYAPTHLELMVRVGHADPLVHAIGQAILSELQRGGLLGVLYLESLFQTLAIHLLRNHAVFAQSPMRVNGNLSPTALRCIRDYVHEHLAQAITLETLAALVHLSPYHFARKFKAATGLAPYQYVLQCRVEQAKSLLTAGHLSICEVAHAVGFASQSHLARHIKQAFGVPPRALRPERNHRQQ